MKTLSLSLLILLAQAVVAAPTSDTQLTGSWRGKLQADPNTLITVEINFSKRPEGGYTAQVSSTDSDALKQVTADMVTWKDSKLHMEVASLSGTYDATLKDGKLEGQWRQPDTTLPLELSAYHPVQLSKADLDTLSGDWSGPLKAPGLTLTIVVRLKADGQSGVSGTFASPDQGNMEFPMTEVAFTNGQLSFKVPAVQGDFKGSYADGAVTGTWYQTPMGQRPGLPVTLKKGTAVAPVHALNLSAQAFVALAGVWHGELKRTPPGGQEIKLPLVLRFNTDEEARTVAFIDSPSQHVSNIPITSASLGGGRLSFKAAALGVEYSGELRGDKLDGRWQQGPVDLEVQFTRDPNPFGR